MTSLSEEKTIKNSFKKKLRQMFHKENLNSNLSKTPLISTKNVSWAEPNTDISNTHVQNTRRSTPFPNRAKKFKADSNIHQSLTFSESESDDDVVNVSTNNSFMSNNDISDHVSDIESGQKRKRRGDLQSEWAVTEQKLKPDKSSTSSWKEKDLLQSPELASDTSNSLDSFLEQIIQYDTDSENDEDSKLNGDTDSENDEDSKLNGDTDSENDEDSKLNGDTDSENDDSDSDDSRIIFDPNLTLAKKIIDNIKANNLPTEDNSFESSDEYSDSVESVYEDIYEEDESWPKLEDYSSEEECISKETSNNRKLSILNDSSSEEEKVHLEQVIVANNKKLPVLDDSSSDESYNENSSHFSFEEIFNPKLVKLDQCVVIEPGKNKNTSPIIEENTNNSITDDSSFSLNYSGNKPPNEVTNKRKRVKRSKENKTQHSDSSNPNIEIPDTKVTKNVDSSLNEKDNTKLETRKIKSKTKKSRKNSSSLSRISDTEPEVLLNIEAADNSIVESELNSLEAINESSLNDTENTESLTRISNIEAADIPIVESELNNVETINDSVNLNDSLDSQIEDIYDIRHIVRYHIAANYCILLLKDPMKLYFHGKLSMIVLSGACEVLGHVLNFEMKKEIDIYSPRGNCFLCFETLNFKSNSNINSTLKEYNMTDIQINSFCTNLPESYCMIAVKNIKNKMLRYLEKHVAQVLFPKILNAYDSKRPLAELENKLQCLFDIEPRYWKVYNTNEDWIPLVNKMILSTKEKFSRTLLCGGKGVGKSVLMRYTINKMLNEIDQVVCIDLDPGQHEFALPGCVSVTIVDTPIFGPNYSHLRKPDKCFFIGDVNIVHCLDRYISSVKAIMKYCEDNISQDLPWVINYMGFTRSLGTDLMISIIKLVTPSLVVQIESEYANRNYTALLTQKYIQYYKSTVPIDTPYKKLNYKLIILNSVADYKVAGEWEYEPRQIREMSVLAYFSQILEDNTEITSSTPYAVKLSSVTLYHVDFTKANISAVINANFVALCIIDNQETLDRTSVISCCGFGIVRGIDSDNKELYILTPVEENDLESVNCLFMGNIAIPPSVYMSAGHEGHVPYISMGAQKGISLIPKRGFRYKSLLKKQ